MFIILNPFKKKTLDPASGFKKNYTITPILLAKP
jgi:hypothetical protein